MNSIIYRVHSFSFEKNASLNGNSFEKFANTKTNSFEKLAFYNCN